MLLKKGPVQTAEQFADLLHRLAEGSKESQVLALKKKIKLYSSSFKMAPELS